MVAARPIPDRAKARPIQGLNAALKGRSSTPGLSTYCPSISGSPFLLLPITTTFVFALLASVSVASMPFHSSNDGVCPGRQSAGSRARRFDALALRLLRFFLQAEIHRQGFLLRLLLGLDGGFQRGEQLNVAQQEVFNHDAPWTQFVGDFLLYLVCNRLALAGVERVGRVRRSCVPDG